MIRTNVFTPRGFLVYGGIALVLLGIIGFIGILSEASTPAFALDDVENVGHTVVGVAALAIALVPGLSSLVAPYARGVVAFLGLASLFLAVSALYVGGNPAPDAFGVMNLESPAEAILYGTFAAWALFAAWGRGSATAAGSADRP